MIRVVYTGTEMPDPLEGVDVLHIPVLGVRTLPFEIPEDAQVAVFFSKNAIQTALKSEAFRTHPWKSIWGVGDESVRLLEEAGFPAISGGGSFETFLGIFPEHSEKVVAFGLKGSPRSLAKTHPGAVDVDVYETFTDVPESARETIASFRPDWVIVGSPRAWDATRDLIPQGVRIAVLGTSTAAQIPHVDYVASEPSLSQLLTELREISAPESHID